MKVLHILPIKSKNYLEANGIAQVVMALSEEQSLLGHQVIILCVGECLDLENALPCNSLNDFEKTFTEFEPDLSIFHGPFYRLFKKFTLFLSKNNSKYLIELHGAYSYSNYHKNFLKKYLYLKYIKESINSAAGIVFLNEKEQADCVIKSNISQLIINNGCRIPALDISAKVPNQKLEILYISRIDKHHKGLDYLMDAINILKEKGYEDSIHFNFWGIGEPEDEKWLNDRIKEVGKIADFYGPAFGETKDKVLRKSDIFILTSRYEGFPMSVLEALSYGLPCIITPQTNMQKIIEKGKCGWITDLGSEKIASVVESAVLELKNKYEELIKNSIDSANLFNWENIAKDSIKKYQSVIS